LAQTHDKAANITNPNLSTFIKSE